MTAEETIAATARSAWTIEVDRADKFFSSLTDAQLQQEIAPGKNRLLYLWGHLVAVHDRMLPLLGVGERLHPELDQPFLSEADRKDGAGPSAAELKRWWDQVNAALAEGFARLTPQEWLQPHTAVSAEDFAKNPLRNRLAVVLNRAGHVSYHMGQCRLAKTDA
jgi:hypothetical protein